MLQALVWIVVPILTAISVHAQATPWVDSATNVTFSRFYVKASDIGYGYVFPPLPAAGQPAADEFIGIFTAPIAAGWVGNALGPGMKNNLLILGWVSGTTPVLSTRYATAYAPPSTYIGPVLTVLRTSGTNTTHQRIIYRCQNCTTWTGGGINLTNSSAVFGYATGTAMPTTPSNPLSGINKHTAAGTHPINITAAHSNQYAVYLQTLTA